MKRAPELVGTRPRGWQGYGKGGDAADAQRGMRVGFVFLARSAASSACFCILAITF